MLTKLPDPFLKMAGHSGICIGEPNLVLFSYFSGSVELQGIFLSPDCKAESFCQRFTTQCPDHKPTPRAVLCPGTGIMLPLISKAEVGYKIDTGNCLVCRWVIQQTLPLLSTAVSSCWVVPSVWSELWESTRIVKRGCVCAAPYKSNKCESY